MEAASALFAPTSYLDYAERHAAVLQQLLEDNAEDQ